jgi:hypothetical protein
MTEEPGEYRIQYNSRIRRTSTPACTAAGAEIISATQWPLKEQTA